MASTTGDILNHHLTSFGEGNLEEVMKDYNEDSVIIAPETKLEGTAAIRGLYETFFAEFGKPGMTFAMACDPIVHRDTAFIAWTAETADNSYEFATDTFHVVDGKIRTQTFAGKITAKG